MSASGARALLRIDRRCLTTIGWLLLLPVGAAIAQDSTRPPGGAARAADDDDSQQVTKVCSLKHAPGEQAVLRLRSLFLVVDQQNAYARFQFDDRTDSLIVAASGRHHKQIARILALIDTPNKAPAQAVDVDRRPDVRWRGHRKLPNFDFVIGRPELPDAQLVTRQSHARVGGRAARSRAQASIPGQGIISGHAIFSGVGFHGTASAVADT